MKVQEFLPDSTKYAGLSDPGPLGLGAKTPPILSDQLTLSQPGGRLCGGLAPIPSGFSDLPTALICKYMNNVLKIVKYMYCLLVSRIKMNSMSMRDGWKLGGGGPMSPPSFCQIY